LLKDYKEIALGVGFAIIQGKRKDIFADCFDFSGMIQYFMGKHNLKWLLIGFYTKKKRKF